MVALGRTLFEHVLEGGLSVFADHVADAAVGRLQPLLRFAFSDVLDGRHRLVVVCPLLLGAFAHRTFAGVKEPFGVVVGGHHLVPLGLLVRIVLHVVFHQHVFGAVVGSQIVFEVLGVELAFLHLDRQLLGVAPVAADALVVLLHGIGVELVVLLAVALAE